MHCRRATRWNLLCLLCTLVALSLGIRPARAGGGPENVFVVVNPHSWASQTIANYFIFLRAIPPSNVMMLPWEGQLDEPISVDLFRDQILEPILTEIDKRGLAQQIDCIAYSSDFPYEVDTSPDLRNSTVPEHLLPGASLTGLTYLSQLVAAKQPYYLMLDVNRYAVLPPKTDPTPPSQAFSSQTAFPAASNARAKQPLQYKLSTMLAVTSGRGTSISQATNDLLRGYYADGTHPQGTIYFVRNNDPRSTTRSPRFQAAMDDLRKLGVKTEAINGTLPIRKNDVMGLTTGAATFDWSASGSTILPGAICDNFTSTGGRLRENGTQTSMAEFLRYGASGSCGTVMEPRTIEAKIPLATVHVHYARGCSLAESFYQSIGGPYQLLIVGDPLCRPWANLAQVGVTGLQVNEQVKGTIELTPAARPSARKGDVPADKEETPQEYAVERFELFVDGKRVAQCQPGEKLTWDTTATSDGYHEVRIVCIEAGAIATQSRCGIPCYVANQGLACEIKSSATKSVPHGDKVTLEAHSPGASQIDLYHAGGLLGNVPGENASLEIDTAQFGLGPMHVWAVAQHAGSPPPGIASAPLRLDIEAPATLPAISVPAEARFAAGVLLTREGARPAVVKDTLDPNWLAAQGLKAQEQFKLDGYCDVPADDLYQLQAGFVGKLKITLDEQVVLDTSTDHASPLQMIPLKLAKGLHHLVVEGECGATVRLEIRFGNVGTWRIGERMFTHLPSTPATGS
ncbi:MAG: TIGR03790 family protein [Pirellulales bacterium]|nr:TIGR03790 family protein [Pirellulales bacterium]